MENIGQSLFHENSSYGWLPNLWINVQQYWLERLHMAHMKAQ